MIRYFAEAEAEMTGTAQFYEDRQSGLGREFLDEIDAALRSLELHPRQCAVFRAPVRRWLLTKFPYGILYVIYHDEIVVIAIAHLSRHPTYWIERLGNPD